MSRGPAGPDLHAALGFVGSVLCTWIRHSTGEGERWLRRSGVRSGGETSAYMHEQGAFSLVHVTAGRPAPRAAQPGLSGTRTGQEEQVPLERPHHRRKRQLQRKVATTIPFPSWVRLLRQRNSAVSSPALPVRTRWGSLVRFKGSGLAWGRAAFRSDVLPPDTEEEAGRQRFFLDYTDQDKDCLGSGDLQGGMG